MNTRFRLWRELLLSTYWFVPSIMAVVAVVASGVTIAVDRRVGGAWATGTGWFWSGGPEGATALLAAIATSMITVAGTVFSVVIVVLTLASNQFGPRLLRNFMRDTGNQVVLGTFIATFLYCLLVARTIRHDGSAATFTPHVSVTVALVLGFVSLGVLIYFFHHVAASIQAEHVIAQIGRDLDRAVGHPFPDAMGRPGPQVLPADLNQRSAAVLSDESGYIDAVDEEAVMAAAGAHDVVLRLRCRPGDFLARGGPVADVYPAERYCDALATAVNAAVLLGSRRTPVQDVEYAIDQLVEVAVRALSPAVNDPYTAIGCVDWLGVALARVAVRPEPCPCRYDDAGRLRVIADVTGFNGVADAALNAIRQYAAGSVPVTIRLLESIATVVPNTRTGGQRDALRCHADMILRQAERSIPEPNDLEDVQERHARVVKLLDGCEGAKSA